MKTEFQAEQAGRVSKDFREPRQGGGPGGRDRYRAVNRLAVLSVVLGLLSPLTVFSWSLGVIPAAGIFLAILGARQVKWTLEETTGLWLARLGLGLSVSMWLVGGGYLAYAQSKEVPPGYTRLTFFDLQPEKPDEKIPSDVKELDGEKVFLKGYMYPGRQFIGIKRFIMVPTTGHCKFCMQQIQPTDRIAVELTGDLMVEYTTHEVGVGGRLRLNEEYRFGEAAYRIEADHFR